MKVATIPTRNYSTKNPGQVKIFFAFMTYVSLSCWASSRY